MADNVGQIFIPANADEIRDQFLRDVRLEADAVGVASPPVGRGTDWHILGTALANIALVQFANYRIADDDSDVLTATGDALEDKRIAYGLPDVRAGGSSGRVVVDIPTGATATIPGNAQLTLPNGKRARVVGTHVGVSDAAEIDVAAIDTGSDTNFPGGTTGVRFVSPPLNVSADTVVSVTSPLTGGTDAETDDRKRDRILNRLQNVPGGGNWGHTREIILNAVPSIDGVYVYPALGGPGSVKVVCTKSIDVDNNDFSRIATADQLQRARSALHAELPSPMEAVVSAAADLNTSVTLGVTIPASVYAGGDGKGWLDSTVWPDLDYGGGETKVTVTGVTSSTVITVSAVTATSPIAGQTHIAWWSRSDRKFRTFLVTSKSGGTGAWVLTVDKPMIDSTATQVQVGDYISPAAVNIDAYGKAWVEMLGKFGPGENTNDANRLPRAKRHPLITDAGAAPISLTMVQLSALVQKFTEISDLEFVETNPATPTVPGTVDDEPQVLVPEHFGIYEQE